MEVDVAVLGGGPGGYTAAIRAAQLGAKVACIEKEPELGGTCLRVGCIPTKAWVQTAHFLHQATDNFAKLGVSVDNTQLDFAAANEWKAGVVKQMTGGVAGLLKANGVEWVNRFGSEVTIVEMLDTLIPQEDADAAKELAKQFTKRGINLQLGKQCTKVEQQGNALTVYFGDGESVQCDLMLVAVGRGPLVEGIGLEAAGVQFDSRKGVTADAARRTTVPHISAVGDCAGYWQLAHTAFS